jgi:hypothetical protein
LHDDKGNLLQAGRKLVAEHGIRETMRDQGPDEANPGIVTVLNVLWAATLFDDGANLTGAFALTLTPLAIAIDVASLPVLGVRAIDVANVRTKLRKMDREKVRITHRRFRKICRSLVGDGC